MPDEDEETRRAHRGPLKSVGEWLKDRFRNKGGKPAGEPLKPETGPGVVERPEPQSADPKPPKK